jgi:hypothetical protein
MNIDTLKSKKIISVVNCQGMETTNYFENDKNKITYLRFPIGNHGMSPFKKKTNEGILRYFIPLFDFIEKFTSSG